MRHNEKFHLKKKWLHLSILYFKMDKYKSDIKIYKLDEKKKNSEEIFYYMFGEEK